MLMNGRTGDRPPRRRVAVAPHRAAPHAMRPQPLSLGAVVARETRLRLPRRPYDGPGLREDSRKSVVTAKVRFCRDARVEAGLGVILAAADPAAEEQPEFPAVVRAAVAVIGTVRRTRTGDGQSAMREPRSFVNAARRSPVRRRLEELAAGRSLARGDGPRRPTRTSDFEPKSL